MKKVDSAPSTGLVPLGCDFWSLYLDYNKYPTQNDAWTAIGGSVMRLFWGEPSCAARVSAALARLPKRDHIPAASRTHRNTVKPGAKGIPGNYIVNAAKMRDYLTRRWGAKAERSRTAAYYYQSKKTKGDVKGLRAEIEEEIRKCGGDPGKDYVAVVSNDHHVGVVRRTYDDTHTPDADYPVVWILPSAKRDSAPLRNALPKG